MTPLRMRLLLLVFILVPLARAAEPLPFRRAIELALRHAGDMTIASSEQVKAHQSYLEARALYYPQVSVGAGIGASAGFPLSLENAAPSLFNLNSSQLVLNPAHREFVRAARTEWNASSVRSEGRRADVVADTAATYLELDKSVASLHILRQQQQAAERISQIVADRVREGVDAQTELTKAHLSAARVAMTMAQVEGAINVLRSHLSDLTGLPADQIVTDPESVPRFPDAQPPDAVARALESSSAIKSADQHALAESFRAKGEHRATWPMVDLAAQYALLSRFNNYDQFFNKFQRHNATVGLVIRFPFLNFSQRARAEGADADALRARKEADAVKAKVSTETLRLQSEVRQLAAGREVARLEHELAGADVDTAQARVQAGTATARDEQAARAAEAEKYAAFLDVSFKLDKAQVDLLRQTGDIEKWAMGESQPAPAQP